MRRVVLLTVVVISLAGSLACNDSEKPLCDRLCEHAVDDCNSPVWGPDVEFCVSMCESDLADKPTEDCRRARAAMFECYANLDCADFHLGAQEVCPDEYEWQTQACQ